jgi:hypothetical protein
MADEYRPRLAIDLTEDQKRQLDKHIPWGTKKAVFNVVVEDLIALCEKHGGGKVIGAFLQRRVKLEQICQLELTE